MGKKKTPVFRNAADKDVDSSKDDKIDAIRTWDDIEHDSEDDCKFKYGSIKTQLIQLFFIVHDERGKVLLNNNQDTEEGTVLLK
jgi:U3 small nucleolar RNA-associated protein 3